MGSANSTKALMEVIIAIAQVELYSVVVKGFNGDRVIINHRKDQVLFKVQCSITERSMDLQHLQSRAVKDYLSIKKYSEIIYTNLKIRSCQS